MSFPLKAALAGVLALGAPLAATVAPAAAHVSGHTSFRGQIIAPAQGGHRTVVASLVAFRGAFRGVGRLVEVPNRPGDPDNVSRDDLVFARGTMHLLSTDLAPPTMSLDPATCVASGAIRQTVEVQGGTGALRHAAGTFRGGVRFWGVAARAADGSCSQQTDPLVAANVVFGRGTLSY